MKFIHDLLLIHLLIRTFINKSLDKLEPRLMGSFTPMNFGLHRSNKGMANFPGTNSPGQRLAFGERQKPLIYPEYMAHRMLIKTAAGSECSSESCHLKGKGDNYCGVKIPITCSCPRMCDVTASSVCLCIWPQLTHSTISTLFSCHIASVSCDWHFGQTAPAIKRLRLTDIIHPDITHIRPILPVGDVHSSFLVQIVLPIPCGLLSHGLFAPNRRVNGA